MTMRFQNPSQAITARSRGCQGHAAAWVVTWSVYRPSLHTLVAALDVPLMGFETAMHMRLGVLAEAISIRMCGVRLARVLRPFIYSYYSRTRRSIVMILYRALTN